MSEQDHSRCCGPNSSWAARQYLLSSGPHSGRAYEWLRQMRDRGFVELRNGRLPEDNWRNDAGMAEARDTSFWLRWDSARGGRPWHAREAA